MSTAAEYQPVSISNEREVAAEDLSIDQLSNLKQQHEEEIKELSSQLDQLFGAKNRYVNARNVLDDMNKSPAGAPMLIPLTSSLYAPGKVQDPNKVIVELGTGYFVEKTIPDAKDLISRKVSSSSFFSLMLLSSPLLQIALIDKSMESIEKVGGGKKKTLEQINYLMNYKIMMAQEMKKQSAAAAGGK
jgi:prefoldin alpha subunit